MKWLKMDCSGRDRELEEGLTKAFGNDGYAIWHKTRAVMAIEIDRELEAFASGETAAPRPQMTVGLQHLAERCSVPTEKLLGVCKWLLGQKKFREYISRAKLSRDKTLISIEMPNFLRDSDKYVTDLIGVVCKKRGLDPEAVRAGFGLRRESLVRDWSETDQSLIPAENSGAAVAERSEDGRRPEGPTDGGKNGEGPPFPPQPPPPPPPGRPQAAAVAAVAASSVLVAETTGAPARIDLPHPISVPPLLHLLFTPAQAIQHARKQTVAEIAGVFRAAGGAGVRSPGAYANRMIREPGWGQSREVRHAEAKKLIEDIVNFDKLFRILGRPGEDPYDFAVRNASGIRLGGGGVMRAAP